MIIPVKMKTTARTSLLMRVIVRIRSLTMTITRKSLLIRAIARKMSLTMTTASKRLLIRATAKKSSLTMITARTNLRITTIRMKITSRILIKKRSKVTKKPQPTSLNRSAMTRTLKRRKKRAEIRHIFQTTYFLPIYQYSLSIYQFSFN